MTKTKSDGAASARTGRSSGTPAAPATTEAPGADGAAVADSDNPFAMQKEMQSALAQQQQQYLKYQSQCMQMAQYAHYCGINQYARTCSTYLIEQLLWWEKTYCLLEDDPMLVAGSRSDKFKELALALTQIQGVCV